LGWPASEGKGNSNEIYGSPSADHLLGVASPEGRPLIQDAFPADRTDVDQAAAPNIGEVRMTRVTLHDLYGESTVHWHFIAAEQATVGFLQPLDAVRPLGRHEVPQLIGQQGGVG
jgi:hypothetical protein